MNNKELLNIFEKYKVSKQDASTLIEHIRAGTDYTTNQLRQSVTYEYNDQGYFFGVDEAIKWYYEQQRRLIVMHSPAKLFGVYGCNIDCYYSNQEEVYIPREEKAKIKEKIQEALKMLTDRQQAIIALICLGDFATKTLYEESAEKAKQLKEEGAKQTLRYNYTNIKVAQVLDVSTKTITRDIRGSYDVLNKELTKHNILK